MADPQRPRDTGAINTLEAVMAVSIMLAGVVFVVTFEQPHVGNQAARDIFEQHASDILAILHDTPVESRYGKDQLSAYLAECMSNRCDNLTKRLDGLVPPGSAYAVYLSNGHESYPVYVKGVPIGEAVSSTFSFEPSWSSTFVETATDGITPEDPLVVYSLPVFHSKPVMDGGTTIQLKMIGRRADGSEYVLLSSYSTLARPADDLSAYSASLHFTDAAGTVMPVWNVTSEPSSTQRVYLRLTEGQGTSSIPAGAEVAVHLPRGWTAIAPAAANPDWTILTDANDRNATTIGSTLRAAMVASLSGGSRSLAIDLTYHGDELDYYPLIATGSKGVHAVGSMIVGGQSRPTPPVLATPGLWASVPSPLGSGGETRWTISAYVPESLIPGGIDDTVTVERIEITALGKEAIFAGVTGDQNMGGTWSHSPDAINWNGNVPLTDKHLLNLSFRVTAAPYAGDADVRSPFVPPIESDGWTTRAAERVGWGFYRQVLLPGNTQYSGYNTTTNGLGTSHTLRSNGVYHTTELPGSTSYNVSLIGAVEKALFGSYVETDTGSIPIGGNLGVSANVQSLIFTLAEAGQKAGVTLRIYPPWTGDERVAIYEQPNLDQGLLMGEVSQIVLLDVNNDGYPDPVVGTTNGRVVAYHALTGQRLQGNSFTVPPTQAAVNAQSVPRITAMSLIDLFGDTYIVVATDKNGDGIHVLARDLSLVWRHDFHVDVDVLALDTKTDFNGDGRPEIVAARTYQQGVNNNALVYVLEAVQGVPNLRPIDATPGTSGDDNAFYLALGTPATVLAQSRFGPDGAGPGFLVPVQTTFEPGLLLDRSQTPPAVQPVSSSTPRAGLQGVNATGKPTSTLFGAPASVLLAYNYGGLDIAADAVDDVVMGGSSGYVIVANGTVLTQPLYSYVTAGGSAFVSADTRTSNETYLLDATGGIYWTDDAFINGKGPPVPAIGGRAIASPTSGTYWVVGAANAIWRGQDVMGEEVLTPTTAAALKGGAPYPFDTNIHELRDIWFRNQEGYIVGNICPALCTEPIFMRTGDGGTTWTVLSSSDATMRAFGGGILNKDLNRVRVMPDGTGYAVGDAGTILRKAPGAIAWLGVQSPFAHNLRDVSCDPTNPAYCIAVGDDSAVAMSLDANAPTPTWINISGTWGLPGAGTTQGFVPRAYNAVSFAGSDRIYIGSNNSVFMSYKGGNFSALPMNYVENDAFAISADANGTGYIVGGSGGNGRIWLLHDYHIGSHVQTRNLADLFPPGAQLRELTLAGGDVSFGGQNITVNASADGGATWGAGFVLKAQSGSPRTPLPGPPSTILWPSATTSDLKLRVTLNTSGDKTVLSPHVRNLSFDVKYDDGGVLKTRKVWLDLASRDQVDEAATTADWNQSLRVLRQPIVNETWVRNVSGQVLDMKTGFDLGGDGYNEIWVATGDIVAENSPDYTIYAGTNASRVVEPDNRIYLLDGRNGTPIATTARFDGEVRHLRLLDVGSDGTPDLLFATTRNSSVGGHGKLRALYPGNLTEAWNVSFGNETPQDAEVGLNAAGPAVFTGTTTTTGARGTGHLHHVNVTSQQREWRIIPDDLGKYYITTKVPSYWLYGAHVVEIEVEWNDTVTPPGGGLNEVLRSARFYDHFMVTTPDMISPHSPLYTAKLLLWMKDWT